MNEGRIMDRGRHGVNEREDRKDQCSLYFERICISWNNARRECSYRNTGKHTASFLVLLSWKETGRHQQERS